MDRRCSYTIVLCSLTHVKCDSSHTLYTLPLPDSADDHTVTLRLSYFFSSFAFFVSRQSLDFPRILTATSFASSACCDSCPDLLSMLYLTNGGWCVRVKWSFPWTWEIYVDNSLEKSYNHWINARITNLLENSPRSLLVICRRQQL